MTTDTSERDRLIRALRRDVPIVLLAALGLLGYLDLRGRIDRAADRSPSTAVLETPEEETVEPAVEGPPVQPPSAPGPDSSWGCTGVVSTADLAQTLREHGGSVVECYRGLLGVLPGARGTLLIDIQVGADGSVLDSRLSGTLRDEQLDECVSRALGSWRFPPAANEGCTVAQVPYMLTPENTLE